MLTHQRNIASNQRAADCRRRLLAACGLCAGLALAPIMAVEAAWTAAMQPDPVTRQSRCLLSSESQTTSDGYDSTPVSLVFNGSSLLAVTESDLDLSFADLQLVVDDKPSVRSVKIVRKTDLVFDQNVPELVQLLRAGRQATIYLRFWPTWPATQTFPVHFSLSGFSKAYDSLNQNCQPAPAPAPSRSLR
ncbi:MAG: hypothetical protein IPL59_00235 [Candidatus Competibacteraceae bacterium]|uniref:AMIN domain-containing protein n=1 Tax=Candidatus Contendobacter odensis Run_B_J11 TaxID=1400861 RepID=A0A7U7GEL4_9GAMM|nr:hypothetical protein [Candidatus Contendobacter odensis]MBK8533659.1 hypothetical protein [Candidatus Competibacteraceae bacterium]MBK8753977.1 hypothetical protein [Candidatus Competibacteraceae bacterium]CDH46946.1 exported hypothetical protein [Candidatus Contendobacter odensis Run_B_J11]